MKCPVDNGLGNRLQRLTIDNHPVNAQSSPLSHQTQTNDYTQQDLQARQVEYSSNPYQDGSVISYAPQVASTSTYSTLPNVRDRQAHQEWQGPTSRDFEAQQTIYDDTRMHIDIQLSDFHHMDLQQPDPQQPLAYAAYPKTDSNITTVGSFYTQHQYPEPNQPDNLSGDAAEFTNELISRKFIPTYDRVYNFIEELPITPGDLQRVERIGSTIEWTDRAFPSQYHLDNQQTFQRRTD